MQATRNSDGSCVNADPVFAVICDGVKQSDQSIFTGGDKEVPSA